MLIVFIIVSFFYFLKENHFKIFKSIIFKILFSLFFIYNIYHCSNIIKDRYWGGWNNDWGKSEKYNKQDFTTITPYIRSLGIIREDKVISIPDFSFNISLYLMDQKGWTGFSNDNNDSIKIAEKIELGAKYLFISDSDLLSKDYLQSFLDNKIGTYNDVEIFDLRHYFDN